MTIVFMGSINQHSHHWGKPFCRRLVRARASLFKGGRQDRLAEFGVSFLPIIHMYRCLYINIVHTYIYIYTHIYIYTYTYTCTFIHTYTYIWSRPPSLHPPLPPHGLGPQVAPPFPSICKLLAAFLRSSFVFARSLQHF